MESLPYSTQIDRGLNPLLVNPWTTTCSGEFWRRRLLYFMIWSDENVEWMLVTKALSAKESHYTSKNKVKPRIQFILPWRKERGFIFHRIQPSKKIPGGGWCQSISYAHTTGTPVESNMQSIAFWCFLYIMPYSKGLIRIDWLNLQDKPMKYYPSSIPIRKRRQPKVKEQGPRSHR